MHKYDPKQSQRTSCDQLGPAHRDIRMVNCPTCLLIADLLEEYNKRQKIAVAA